MDDEHMIEELFFRYIGLELAMTVGRDVGDLSDSDYVDMMVEQQLVKQLLDQLARKNGILKDEA